MMEESLFNHLMFADLLDGLQQLQFDFEFNP